MRQHPEARSTCHIRPMPNHIPMPPLERLNELLEVVEIPPDKFGKWSGLVWKVNRGGKARAGSVAGYLDPNAKNPIRVDWRVTIDNVGYYVPRVIYYITTKKDPKDIQVDHKDQNWFNNNMWNLRLDVDGRIQKINEPTRKNNTSGAVGVNRHKTGKWIARVEVKDQRVYLGLFTCKIEAAHAINEKWRELGWLKLGRKLNNLNAIHCDCDKCKSKLDKITE